MSDFRQIVLALIALLPLAAVSAETEFVRVDTDADGEPRALQLAIVSYVPADGTSDVRVDLVGAVHIGDKAYYAELNERFQDYDALLFELVAPGAEAIVENAGKQRGLLSKTQVGMTKMLDLSFQLDEIDYSPSNFVHADLTPEEFKESMAERNESLYVYFWRVVFASVNEYAKDPLGLRDWQMISAMVKSEESNSFKIMMAYEMTNLDTVQDVLGEDSSTAIVGARNEKAIEVLRSQLDQGGGRFGIFYGVAHMPDLEDRLINEVGLRYQETFWVDAWLFAND